MGNFERDRLIANSNLDVYLKSFSMNFVFLISYHIWQKKKESFVKILSNTGAD